MKMLFQTLLFVFLIQLSIVSVHAQIVSIPDPDFRAAIFAISPAIDTNGDGEIQETEAAAFTGVIDIDNKGIADLTGIEAFTRLTVLRASVNQLETVDLSKNVSLEIISLAFNALTSLDISNNQALTALVVSTNQLINLDISNNPELTYLDISRNTLSSINLTANPKLQALDLFGNQLSTLDLRNQPDLQLLNVLSNNLTELNVGNNVRLESLQISNNPISGNLDLSTHRNLEYLQVNSTAISGLNIANGNNTAMTDVDFNALNTANLICIQVDDVGYAQANFSQIDSDSNFSLNCGQDSNNGREIYGCTGQFTATTASLSGTALIGSKGSNPSDFTIGSVLLYRTSEARNGKLLVTGFSGPGNFFISFDFVTFNADGTSHAAGSWRGGGNIDLDNGNQSSGPLATDVVWNNSKLTPVNRVGLHVYNGLVAISDRNFEAALVNHNPIIDANGDRKIQICEAKAFNGVLNLNNHEIRSLSGIGAFSNAIVIRANDNAIEQVDFRWNQELIAIEIFNNKLTTINLENNRNLTSLNCVNNELTSLVVSNNRSLMALSANNNRLITIDLDRNGELNFLELSGNQLSSIDLTNNVKLRKLYLNENELTTLDITRNDQLVLLSIEKNKLSVIDLRNQKMLESLFVSDNLLSALNLEKNPNLRWMKASDNNLTTIIFYKGAPLISIEVSRNQISNLKLRELPFLEKLIANKNRIEVLNFEESLSLKHLDISSNKINGALDLSNFTKLQNIYVNSNQLLAMDISNGTNHQMTSPYDFNSLNNPDLNCIQVDDISYAESTFTLKDDHTTYRTDCGFSRERSAELSELPSDDIENEVLVFPNPASGKISIKSPEGGTLLVYDSNGRELKKVRLSGLDKIDLAGIGNGLLLVKILNDSGTVLFNKKVIKMQ